MGGNGRRGCVLDAGGMVWVLRCVVRSRCSPLPFVRIPREFGRRGVEAGGISDRLDRVSLRIASGDGGVWWVRWRLLVVHVSIVVLCPTLIAAAAAAPSTGTGNPPALDSALASWLVRSRNRAGPFAACCLADRSYVHVADRHPERVTARGGGPPWCLDGGFAGRANRLATKRARVRVQQTCFSPSALLSEFQPKGAILTICLPWLTGNAGAVLPPIARYA